MKAYFFSKHLKLLQNLHRAPGFVAKMLYNFHKCLLSAPRPPPFRSIPHNVRHYHYWLLKMSQLGGSQEKLVGLLDIQQFDISGFAGYIETRNEWTCPQMVRSA